MAKISVVVPVYNVERYLEGCLNSLLEQTLEDIEIICVDDCSTDNSLEILNRFQSENSKIRVIRHERNLSTSQARKNGVLSAQGKYIMFVDSDDALRSDACEVAFHAIEKAQTDILQFGTEVVNVSGVPEERIRMNERLLKPYVEEPEISGDLIKACWSERKFGFTLWNKIYNGNVCRKAFREIEDGIFSKDQDLYAFFIIAYYAKSYSAISETLYHYRFGAGVTGKARMDLRGFQGLLTERDIVAAIKRFLEKQKNTQYEEIIQGIYQHFLKECSRNWAENLVLECKDAGYEMLTERFGECAVLCGLAGLYWYKSEIVTGLLKNNKNFRIRKREQKKTIAFYYRNVVNGGAQRVTAELCRRFSEVRQADGTYQYRVILVVEGKRSEDEYFAGEHTIHEYLPSREEAKKNGYCERYQRWQELIETYEIDFVVSGMWCDPVTAWDMLAVKSHSSHPAFIIHAHSFCCVPYSFQGSTALNVVNTYKVADGVVTLSDADREYASCFNVNTKKIYNPVFVAENVQSEFEENTVLWVGRLSAEKQPMELVWMMEYLVKIIPDAKLYIVGDGASEVRKEMEECIESNGLSGNVFLEGYCQDVEKYYEKASVLVITSQYEGASLTLLEAQTYGIPIVGYDMPWQSQLIEEKGAIMVPQNRPDIMAVQVGELLKDSNKAKALGARGKKEIKKILSADLVKEWESVFDAVGSEDRGVSNSTEKTILEYITRYQQQAKMILQNKHRMEFSQKLQKVCEEKLELTQKLQKTYDEKSELTRKLQKTYDEKSELTKKLQNVYDEKSEINRRLKITYQEKYDRGIEINNLKKKIEKNKKENKRLQKELDEANKPFAQKIWHKVKGKINLQ